MHINSSYDKLFERKIIKQLDYSYLNQLVGHLTGLAHLRATQLCTEELADLGLTPKQFVTLEFIANNPGESQKEIAAHVGTTPTVLVNVLDVLTARGYVKRIRSEHDRRRHMIVITPKGESVRSEIKAAAFAVESRLKSESDLSEDEWETLLLLMRKLTHRQPINQLAQ